MISTNAQKSRFLKPLKLREILKLTKFELEKSLEVILELGFITKILKFKGENLRKTYNLGRDFLNLA